MFGSAGVVPGTSCGRPRHLPGTALGALAAEPGQPVAWLCPVCPDCHGLLQCSTKARCAKNGPPADCDADGCFEPFPAP